MRDCFQDLTGIEEMSRCRELLQRHNWDMEVAVQSRFNEAEGAPPIYHEPQREQRAPQVDTHPADQRYVCIEIRVEFLYVLKFR